MLAAAINYAAKGVHVLPLHGIVDGRCTCGHDCGRNAGKHPYAPFAPHGLNNATADEATVKRWFGGALSLNIGIRTGAVSGVLVADWDARNGGAHTRQDVESTHGRIDTAQVLTPGGVHDYFRHPGGFIKSSNGVLPGLDVKADNGYVVAPPSMHYSGKRYTREASGTPIADAPSWLLDLVAPKQDGSHGGGILPERIPSGRRFEALLSFAGILRRWGLTEGEIVDCLRVVNLRCEPECDEAGLLRVARAIGKYDPVAFIANGRMGKTTKGVVLRLKGWR